MIMIFMYFRSQYNISSPNPSNYHRQYTVKFVYRQNHKELWVSIEASSTGTFDW